MRNSMGYIKENIKNWPQEDRPREKLFKKGPESLSNSELLAILLRTGTNGSSAIDLARNILSKFSTFRNMSHTDARDWKEFKGLGMAKIAQIKAALEIARRFNTQDKGTFNQRFVTTEDVVNMYSAEMRTQKVENVKVILCDVKTRLIDAVNVARGTPTESHPIIRDIISIALQQFAAGIILVHSHPNGDSLPTKEDNTFTEQLKSACSIMKIKMLDHIIFGETGYYSYAKQNSGLYTQCITKI